MTSEELNQKKQKKDLIYQSGLYEIDKMAIDKAINKLKPNKAPGRDMITGYWYKQLNFYRSDLTRLYNLTLINDEGLPTWLSTAKIPFCQKILIHIEV